MIQVIGDNCPVLLRHTFLNEKRADYKRNIYCGGGGIIKELIMWGRDNENKEGKGENVQKLKRGQKNGDIVQGDCIK